MREILLVVDVQASFSPPHWLVTGIRAVANRMPSVATVERHDESRTPFERQLGRHPAADDASLVDVDRVFIKYGYLPPREMLDHLVAMKPERVLVCGMQTETCVLAAGFMLFDAGLTPTLVKDLTVGSSIDRSGELGTSLWRHHFRQLITVAELDAQA
ncbi:isochorismatase family protein [Paraburkholderia rhizosphaerae]|uniref:Nicotinamidase-related amidase n=1 Tax=Paraburkholderia rhizosphaerae TaxID=480658 RepID=A0A4R8LVB0_9BURK|nr:cysteine hydrolase family protein [Paraburkholderia rhizosphaerae]TDY51508.1 nicotinamidase-related amidase [Paraburkholderia rhizosphaerae]